MRRFALLMLVVVTAVLLTACGGGEPVTLDYTGYDEFRFDPPRTTISTGSEVTINFENAGVLDHNWMLTSSQTEVAMVRESDARGDALSGVIAGGTSNTFSFTAPPAGEYRVVCTVPGHAAAGMVADFIVTP